MYGWMYVCIYILVSINKNIPSINHCFARAHSLLFVPRSNDKRGKNPGRSLRRRTPPFLSLPLPPSPLSPSLSLPLPPAAIHGK